MDAGGVGCVDVPRLRRVVVRALGDWGTAGTGPPDGVQGSTGTAGDSAGVSGNEHGGLH